MGGVLPSQVGFAGQDEDTTVGAGLASGQQSGHDGTGIEQNR